MDLWTEATYDIEAEQRERQLIAAREEMTDLWPFLAGAGSQIDYANRKALVEDRFNAASQGDPGLRKALVAAFDEDFKVIEGERETKDKRDTEFRARVEAENKRRFLKKQALEVGIWVKKDELAQAQKESSRKTAEKWRAEVTGLGESVWSNNAREYDTREEAEAWLSDLSMRWFGYDMGRVVLVSTPKREPVNLDEEFFQNFRSGSRRSARRDPFGGSSKTAGTRYDTAKRVVENRQTEHLEGALLDSTTAHAMVRVYEGLGPEAQEKFESMPLGQLIPVIWKMHSGSKTVRTFNLATGQPGPVYEGITPEEAVVAANAQSKDDFNTWDYGRYEVIENEKTVRSGDFTAFKFPGQMASKTAATIDNGPRDFFPDQLIAQIGKMNILAVSGGRIEPHGNGIRLPVQYGYAVDVFLEADDTYTVQTTFTRSGTTSVKHEWQGVYAEEVGEAVYQASLWRDLKNSKLATQWRVVLPVKPGAERGESLPRKYDSREEAQVEADKVGGTVQELNPPEQLKNSRKTAQWIDNGEWGAEYESEGIGEAYVRPYFEVAHTGEGAVEEEQDGWDWDAFSYDSLPLRGSGHSADKGEAKHAAEEWVKANAGGTGVGSLF